MVIVIVRLVICGDVDVIVVVLLVKVSVMVVLSSVGYRALVGIAIFTVMASVVVRYAAAFCSSVS